MTATRKASNEPSVVIDTKIMETNPAAGPLTLSGELLSEPTTIPPSIPAIIPLKRGAPPASAIPKHKGNATKNTTMPAGKSCLNR